jgi:hypothetical protein
MEDRPQAPNTWELWKLDNEKKKKQQPKNKTTMTKKTPAASGSRHSSADTRTMARRLLPRASCWPCPLIKGLVSLGADEEAHLPEPFKTHCGRVQVTPGPALNTS